MDKNLQKLAGALKGIKKPSLSASESKIIKERVFSRIYESKRIQESKSETPLLSHSLNLLRIAVKKAASGVSLSAQKRARMKERVISAIEKTSGKRLFTPAFKSVLQKSAAVFVIAALALTSFTVYLSDLPVTKAARTTYFQDVSGVVEVVRNNKLMDAHEDMILEQGDIVITGANGIAVIRYLDDSVTRLSPLTELKLNRLYRDVENNAKTAVELELSYGRVWTQVINLVDKESSFELSTDDIVAASGKVASFDVEKNENVSVKVFDNTVEVSVKDKDKQKKQYLSEGYEMSVDKDLSNFKKIVVNRDDEDEESWIKINKVKDKEYKEEVEKEVKEQQKKEAGVLPKDPLYSVKKLSENTKVLMAGDDNSKTRLKVDMAKKRLLEAGAMFDSGEDEKAKEALDEFSSLVSDIKGSVRESEELKKHVKDVFSSQTKELAVISPGSPYYPVKESLREAKKELALSELEKKETAFETASEKIHEAKDLVEEKQNDAAADALVQANENVSEAASDEVDDDVLNAHVETLSSIKLLKKRLNADYDNTRELNRLVDTTEKSLKEGLEEAIKDPESGASEDTKEKADTVLREGEPDSEIIYLDDSSVESDSALIMPALQEEQE
jgi:hypothetical protein